MACGDDVPQFKALSGNFFSRPRRMPACLAFDGFRARMFTAHNR